MATGAYEYLSDDGTTYQVVLPSELASALGYVPATGFEPYVPSYLQMRYATYQSVPSQLSLVAPITFPFRNGVPPSNFFIGGQSYFVKSLYGEQRNANVNQMIQTISGPQGPGGAMGPAGPTGPAGPSGPSGPLLVASTLLSASQLLNIATSPVLLINPSSSSGYGAVPVHIAAEYQRVTTDYTSHSTLQLLSGSLPVATFTAYTGPAGPFQSTYAPAAGYSTNSRNNGQSIFIGANSNWAGGDGVIWVNVSYFYPGGW